jgi:uncharacterized membrane protein
MLLAASSTQFLPPISPLALLGSLAALAAAALALAWLLGAANIVSRQWSLWILRACILAVAGIILLNPARVDESPGPVERPELFYLIDASSSMQIGSPRSRWDEALSRIEEASRLATSSPALVKPFRFGQRLAAIEHCESLGIDAPENASKSVSLASAGPPATAAPRPTDSDTRLLTALRQISSRFGRTPPRGLVVFSDGRTHDDTGLAQLAQQFARLKVPIHVVPVGDTSKGGDIAVAAAVVPPRARKSTEIEAQVFVRSFGYDGKRSEVQLLEVDNRGRAGRMLVKLPITLQSGFQSVSLNFRTEASTRRLRIAIPPLADEVTDRNNHVEAEISIDRTKIRVLYIEGSSQPLSQVRVADRMQLRGPFTDLKQALTEDEDIECVVLIVERGSRTLRRIAESSAVDGVRGFPATMAELAAFDCLILSNVGSETLTPTQFQWIDHWIGQRGGGLCMIGGENSFASGGWRQTPLAAMLPVELAEGYDWLPGETIKVVPQLPPAPHPLWNLLADDRQNREVVAAFPPVVGVNRWEAVRPSLTNTLATTSIAGTPVATARPRSFGFGTVASALQQMVGGQNPRNRTATAASTTGAGDAPETPAIVAGRYGRGRTAAIAFPMTAPYADELVQKWGQGDNRYYAKFSRNLVYWLTESSSIGRRRLVATTDKRFYRPGDPLTLQAATYDESAAPTKNYRVVAMVEPHTAPGETEPENSPLRWPEGLRRSSGESGPFVAWGEEFELGLSGNDPPLYALQLPLAESLASGASNLALRVELTAYEGLTQVDSTSLDVQVLHDPFEQQNPFPNHELLTQLADASGGKVLRSAADLASVLRDVPQSVGPPVVRRSPLWSNIWVLSLLLGLLTVEWCWRRSLGLA